MNTFRIKIADCVAEVRTIYPWTRQLCQKFLSGEVPDIFIEIDQEDIDFERSSYVPKSKIDCPKDDYLESVAVLRKFSASMIDRGAFLFHGGVIAWQGNAFLFTAHSGTGKTMHLYRWLYHLPEAIVVNGDKPFIKPGDVPTVYGSPFAGKEGMYENMVVPLKAIVFLTRAENNNIWRIPFIDAFPILYEQVYRPKESQKLIQTIQLLKQLEGRVNLYHFEMNNFKEDCYQVAYDALVNTNSSLKNC